MGWAQQTYDFLAGGDSLTLSFQSLQPYGSGDGPALDNVSLLDLGPNVVPEPISMLLLGAGLAGILAVRQRVKK